MRGQTKSGGFTQNPALSYPIYAEVQHPTADISVAINTGPSFDDALPAGYSSWADGLNILVFPDSLALTVLVRSVTVVTQVIGIGGGQPDGDGGRAGAARKRKRAKIFFIITEAAKKVVERPGPLRKKRKKLAKIIAEEFLLPEAGGLLAADKLLLELMIRRQLEQIPLGDLHTEAWPQLQEMLMQVITDAEQTAQRLRAEAEEEDDLLLLLTS